ncbi:MAG: EamA family transporter [bacterium]|nr:EamA family transporter [bacterium]
MAIILSYIFYFIASTLSSLQIRWLTKKHDLESREQVRFTFQIIAILFLGSLTFPFFSPFHLSGNYYHLFLLFLVCGVFGAGCNLFAIFAQKHLDAGVSSVVGNIYTPLTIILSSLLLREGLAPMQIVGTLLLLMAMFIVSQKHRIGRFTFNKYFLMMLLSGVLLSVLLVAERALQKTTGFSAGVMLSWGAQALFLGLIALFVKSKHTYSSAEVWGTGLVKFLGATSWVTLVYVVGNLSLVSSITTFKVIIVFVAAALFLNEKEDLRRKIFGCILAVIGLLLM